MEYRQLLKESYRATFRHKRMWWLGMAVVGGGGGEVISRIIGQGINISLDENGETVQKMEAFFESPLLRLWLEDYWWIVLIMGVSFFLLWIAAIIFHLIARSGLYYGADQARTEQPVYFGKMVQAGVNTFWRYIGFYILLALIENAVMLLLFFNILWLALTIIGVIFAFPLLIISIFLIVPLAMALEVFVIYSLQGITLKRYGIIETMRTTWETLRHHVGENALAYLLIMLIKLVASFAVAVLVVILATPFAILAYVTYTSDAIVGAGLIVFSGLLLIGVLLFIWKGILQSFFSHFWNRVYTLCQ